MRTNYQIAEPSATYLSIVAAPTEIQTRPSPRFLDFWLMGGASILVWMAMAIGQFFRDDYMFVEQRFQQVGITFSMLSLVCNHPHFMASYRLAYGRGRQFTFKHWFCLIAVPLILISLYLVAFLNFEAPVTGTLVGRINSLFSALGVGYRLGEAVNLGRELLGVSVWIMNLTVGWHYSKQVFGCMMVYAKYDSYPLTAVQRLLIKSSLFFIAFHLFCNVNMHWRDWPGAGGSFLFFSMPVTELGLPQVFDSLATIGLYIGILAFAWVLLKVYWERKRLPTLNFLVPFVAFFIWWVPLFKQKEFYFMMVPFFHSLQYLPFAYRMELASLPKGKRLESALTIRFVLLLICGFLAFEAVPSLLDMWLSSRIGSFGVFFSIAFLVFINVHHFFLDSVLWRFGDSKVNEALFSSCESRRLK